MGYPVAYRSGAKAYGNGGFQRPVPYEARRPMLAPDYRTPPAPANRNVPRGRTTIPPVSRSLTGAWKAGLGRLNPVQSRLLNIAEDALRRYGVGRSVFGTATDNDPVMEFGSFTQHELTCSGRIEFFTYGSIAICGWTSSRADANIPGPFGAGGNRIQFCWNLRRNLSISTLMDFEIGDIYRIPVGAPTPYYEASFMPQPQLEASGSSPWNVQNPAWLALVDPMLRPANGLAGFSEALPLALNAARVTSPYRVWQREAGPNQRPVVHNYGWEVGKGFVQLPRSNAFPKRPEKDEKERKFHVTANGKIRALRAGPVTFGMITEGVEVVDILFNNVPRDWQGQRGQGNPSPQAKLATVFKNFDRIDWGQVGKDLIWNEVEDQVRGRMGRAAAEGSRRTGQSHGVTLGVAL